jgi:hypothetical protein
MCRFNIYYNGSYLSSGNIKLVGGHLGLVDMKSAYLEVLVGAGIGNITKSSVV